MTFWRVRFDDKKEGFGWLKFDDQMVEIGLFEDDGEPVKEPCGYTPIEFDTNPEWA